MMRELNQGLSDAEIARAIALGTEGMNIASEALMYSWPQKESA